VPTAPGQWQREDRYWPGVTSSSSPAINCQFYINFILRERLPRGGPKSPHRDTCFHVSPPRALFETRTFDESKKTIFLTSFPTHPFTPEMTPRKTPPTTGTEMSQFFYLTEKEAAQHFDVCLTSFKKICRSRGLRRWPHRKVSSRCATGQAHHAAQRFTIWKK
jgi:hypothetical protein